MRKPYAELTNAGKAKRLAKYEKENAAERKKLEDEWANKPENKGKTIELVDCLANLVRAPKLRENKNGSKTAVMRLAIYNAETKTTEFANATVYIAPEKVGQKFENFVASLEKGDLVSIRYAKSPDHNTLNVWSLFKRERKQKQEEA